MQSSNPVFRKAEGFNGQSRTYPASGMTYPAYGAPTQTDPYRQQAPIYGDTATGGRMTIDTVVQKTGLTLGLTILVAALVWVLTPPLDSAAAGSLYLLAMVGAFGGFALSLVNSFKRVVSPALVELARSAGAVAVVEDNLVSGGIGSAVTSALREAGIDVPVHTFGIPKRFLAHASRSELLEELGLTADTVVAGLAPKLTAR